MHFLAILSFLQGSLIYSEVWCVNHTILPHYIKRNLLIHSNLLFVLLVDYLGLSSIMNVRIVYLDIMRPFAESVLLG